mmetsp:Transcript_98406/g.263025  ORF Transcript_98406/g.263025 Transcript_98406/m.263025 type:complete len:202 (+) Transcript_98406:205-810(+)
MTNRMAHTRRVPCSHTQRNQQLRIHDMPSTIKPCLLVTGTHPPEWITHGMDSASYPSMERSCVRAQNCSSLACRPCTFEKETLTIRPVLASAEASRSRTARCAASAVRKFTNPKLQLLTLFFPGLLSGTYTKSNVSRYPESSSRWVSMPTRACMDKFLRITVVLRSPTTSLRCRECERRTAGPVAALAVGERSVVRTIPRL